MLVERFLFDDYEERQLSTYALTMYRHNAKIEGKEYKIGNYAAYCKLKFEISLEFQIFGTLLVKNASRHFIQVITSEPMHAFS